MDEIKNETIETPVESVVEPTVEIPVESIEPTEHEKLDSESSEKARSVA